MAAAPPIATLRLGTCSFSAHGWEGSFYPPGLSRKDRLSYYATQFDTLELDVTFYRVPTADMITSWYDRTPSGFLFAAKAPRVITHEKRLIGCQTETHEYLNAMAGLRDKLGPILFQFPYYARDVFPNEDPFLNRLEPFLKSLPNGFRYAVEVRNKWWIGPKLTNLLGQHHVALTLIDHNYMHRPKEMARRVDPVTSDFTYVRLLGDRYGIEKLTHTWDKVIVDRHADLEDWVEVCDPIRRRGVPVYGYINNHYAGHSPATIRTMFEMTGTKPNVKPREFPSLRKRRPPAAQQTLLPIDEPNGKTHL